MDSVLIFSSSSLDNASSSDEKHPPQPANRCTDGHPSTPQVVASAVVAKQPPHPLKGAEAGHEVHCDASCSVWWHTLQPAVVPTGHAWFVPGWQAAAAWAVAQHLPHEATSLQDGHVPKGGKGGNVAGGTAWVGNGNTGLGVVPRGGAVTGA
ncbi:hypothetical protein DIPPA_18296 [Diplonema papillatum]|nr:hypothetical protein DIPPA_18296 [Diplonema papillatum]